MTIISLVPYTEFLSYNDVIMSTMASQITNLTIVYSTVYQGADEGNIKAVRHYPLWGEFTGDRASNAENVSIWWRHHASPTPGRRQSVAHVLW